MSIPVLFVVSLMIVFLITSFLMIVRITGKQVKMLRLLNEARWALDTNQPHLIPSIYKRWPY